MSEEQDIIHLQNEIVSSAAAFNSITMLHENILDSMDNGVIALDFEGKIITFNKASARILGVPVEHALGKYYPEVFFELPGNDEFNDVLINVIYTRQTYLHREVNFMRDESTAIPLGITSSLLKNVQGQEYGVVSVFSDLSEVKKRQFLQDTLTRYVTKDVVDLILEHPENIILDGEERTATVLFCDIRGFTSISERMQPKELVHMLREYFTLMVGAVFTFQGTVDKFIGDCIMAIFGAPTPQPNHAALAVLAALEMKKLLQQFNAKHAWGIKDSLRIGVGINTGDVVVGNIGSEQRLEYTAIGDAVNLASRLEGINKQYGTEIIVSESTYFQVGENNILAREIDEVRVKGKQKPVKIYEILGYQDEMSDAHQQLCRHFVQGLECYRSRKWEQALRVFQDALECVPSDTPSRLYIERCTLYQQDPPAEPWDGVFEMKTK